MTSAIPCVLCLSGHDPTGGAGLAADIGAITALGGHALGVITANTVQDTSDVRRVAAVPPILIAAQLEALVQDCRIDAVKIGLLGDAAQVDPILDCIRRLRVPVVLDPVLRAGGGAQLVNSGLLAALRERLLPAVTVLTPNAAEARVLCGGEDMAGLLALGVANVLVTRGDEPGGKVVNTWYRAGQPPRHFEWPRLAQRFHGAGCTLASAIAALLAAGRPLDQALEQAQAYTHGALSRAYPVGAGRLIPGRSIPA
ncbi:hydroxymethylpyrimidine/phosphomethylpyrimidine kinase [Solimonas sp. K1W22B-7]|uniref:bifunctional hydroxymethylpyrimidine kinase/phosphomethylpyrimidine kinase n=1 Tax=Solimonas sp. K1W22B-7 TaxID=2303331 RepID=UPI000E32FF0B|nr:hydroxymethylpyrimidine/phosphomethylpyrimidine kinase [Solimonas sp. K1W22B-7]AXQ30957.1 hydroxymethylpyrimidine/phosphomethylpyrimidine kinase [Solimonas sp. K1W22B-7]